MKLFKRYKKVYTKTNMYNFYGECIFSYNLEFIYNAKTDVFYKDYFEKYSENETKVIRKKLKEGVLFFWEDRPILNLEEPKK